VKTSAAKILPAPILMVSESADKIGDLIARRSMSPAECHLSLSDPLVGRLKVGEHSSKSFRFRLVANSDILPAHRRLAHVSVT
jgi:hypothetical protein